MPLWSRIISDCTSLDTGVIHYILPLTPITNWVRFSFFLHALNKVSIWVYVPWRWPKAFLEGIKLPLSQTNDPSFLVNVRFHLLEFPLTSPPASLNYPFNSPSSRLHPANHSRWSSGTTANLFEVFRHYQPSLMVQRLLSHSPSIKTTPGWNLSVCLLIYFDVAASVFVIMFYFMTSHWDVRLQPFLPHFTYIFDYIDAFPQINRNTKKKLVGLCDQINKSKWAFADTTSNPRIIQRCRYCYRTTVNHLRDWNQINLFTWYFVWLQCAIYSKLHLRYQLVCIHMKHYDWLNWFLNIR